jgi:ribose transport system substrate-binding protein
MRSAALAIFMTVEVACCIPCTTRAANDSNTIYYFIPTFIDEFQTESQKAIEVVFGELGYSVISVDAEEKSNQQLAQLRKVISRRPRAVILNSVDFKTIMPAVDEAKQANIPVLVYDGRLFGSQPTFTSTSDAKDIGRSAAIVAKRLLNKRYNNEQGKILQISGDPSYAWSREANVGFLAEVFRTTQKIEIYSRPAMRWSGDSALKIASEQLSGPNSDIDLVFCHAADLCEAVIRDVKQKGMKPAVINSKPSDRMAASGSGKFAGWDHLMFISSNGAPIGLKHLRNGWQQAEIEQPLYAEVIGLARAMVAIESKTLSDLKGRTCIIENSVGSIAQEEDGLVLKFRGNTITAEEIDKEEARLPLWGELRRPRVTAADIKAQCSTDNGSARPVN